jgi:Glycosyl transferase family 2
MKEWTGVLDQVPENLRRDRLFQREADRFFTVLMARRHNTMPARVRRLKDHDTEGIAQWREPDHWLCKGLAVREALQMVRRRSSPAPSRPWHIVITCGRDRRFLRDTARSVLCNDADYELSIVDDAANGETPNVVEELRELCPSLRFIRSRGEDGGAASHNRAIRAVDGTFVVLLDAGDMLGADYLYDARRLLERGVDVANPGATCNPVHRCAAFRRSLWARVGGFDETATGGEDHDFWGRAAAGARIEALPGNHVFCRPGRQGRIKHAKTKR